MFDPKSRIIAFESSGYEAVMEHRHDFIEIIYILQGEGIHQVNGCELPLHKGDLFVITKEDGHSIIPTAPAEEFRWVNCIIDREFVAAEQIETVSEKKTAFAGRADISSIIYMLLEEYSNKNLYYEEVMKGLAISLIGKYRRALDLSYASNTAENTEVFKRSETYLTAAIGYLHANYNKKLSIDTVAEKIGISTGYLERLFREERSTTPVECLNIYRIEQACRLLIVSDKSIADISEEVGFNDIKFFYTMFKRQTGVTPRIYRHSKKSLAYSVETAPPA